VTIKTLLYMLLLSVARELGAFGAVLTAIILV
jgi:hypothetical protein